MLPTIATWRDKYCFAGKGEYDGRREIMSYEVGKQALDYLIANSPAAGIWKWTSLAVSLC